MDALADGGGAQHLEYGVFGCRCLRRRAGLPGTYPRAGTSRSVGVAGGASGDSWSPPARPGGPWRIRPTKRAVRADLRTRARMPDRLRADRSGWPEDGRLVVLHNPPLRMVIVGAVHIAQALVPMARIAGFDPVASSILAARLRQRGAVPGHPCFRRVARRGDGAPGWMRARGGHPDPRSQAGRSRDPRGAGAEAFYVGASAPPAPMASERNGCRALSTPRRAHPPPVGLNIGAAGPAEIAVRCWPRSIRVEAGREVRAGPAWPRPAGGGGLHSVTAGRWPPAEGAGNRPAEVARLAHTGHDASSSWPGLASVDVVECIDAAAARLRGSLCRRDAR